MTERNKVVFKCSDIPETVGKKMCYWNSDYKDRMIISGTNQFEKGRRKVCSILVNNQPDKVMHNVYNGICQMLTQIIKLKTIKN